MTSALDTPWPDLGVQQGDIELAGHDWHWRKAVVETPFETVRRVEVQVFSDPASEDYSARIAGYVGEKVRW